MSENQRSVNGDTAFILPIVLFQIECGQRAISGIAAMVQVEPGADEVAGVTLT
jgi:hypothetical protein